MTARTTFIVAYSQSQRLPTLGSVLILIHHRNHNPSRKEIMIKSKSKITIKALPNPKSP